MKIGVLKVRKNARESDCYYSLCVFVYFLFDSFFLILMGFLLFFFIVCDFGLSRVYKDTQSTKLTACGTPCWTGNFQRHSCCCDVFLLWIFLFLRKKGCVVDLVKVKKLHMYPGGQELQLGRHDLSFLNVQEISSIHYLLFCFALFQTTHYYRPKRTS
jgi:hypothetical protein